MLSPQQAGGFTHSVPVVGRSCLARRSWQLSYTPAEHGIDDDSDPLLPGFFLSANPQELPEAFPSGIRPCLRC